MANPHRASILNKYTRVVQHSPRCLLHLVHVWGGGGCSAFLLVQLLTSVAVSTKNTGILEPRSGDMAADITTSIT